MRVLMLGWEFPPFISGGLGTACFGMTKALSHQGVKILFVLPRIKGPHEESHVDLISASDIPVPAERHESDNYIQNVEFRTIESILRPYLSETEYEVVFESLQKQYKQTGATEAHTLPLSGDYGGDLIQEALRYGRIVGEIAKTETFDIIHGHDWLTTFAGVEAKRNSGKPFVYHAHALEFDRSGENINQSIYDIERFAMNAADHIIAVSHYTKNIIANRYGINPEKITVVHNAVTRENTIEMDIPEKRPGRKIVLFLGRITYQKGPDYFIEAAARVLKYFPKVTFLMAGAGDMRPRMIERVAQLGIGRNFHFLGFIEGMQIERVFAMSDLYVMPSISEPFGISPLEAMLRDVPVIISKQSGVSEVILDALKVDFWDIRELAHKIISVLRYPALSREMVKQAHEALRTIHWAKAAEKIMAVYNHLIH